MIYIFVLVLIFIGIYKYDLNGCNTNNRQSNILYFTTAFILFFIAAFRYYNGSDTANYAQSFYQIPLLQDFADHHLSFFRYQKGYLYFVAFIKEIWNNFLIQQIITALFVNVVIFRFIKKYSPYVFLTTLIYFILNYFEYNMEIMRECISVAFGLLAYECLRHKQYVFMALLIYFAYQFHISALILILMPLFAFIQFSKKSFFVVLMVAISLPTLYIAIPNLEVYVTLLFSDQEEWANEAYLIQEYSDTLSLNFYITHILKFIVIPFSLLWILNKNNKFKFTGLTYVYSLLQLLSMFSYAFYRFANYFAPFYWITLAYAIVLIASNFPKIKTAVLAVSLLLLVYLHQNIQFYWDNENGQYMYNRYIPHKWVFFNDGY